MSLPSIATLAAWRDEAQSRLNEPNPFFKRQLDLLDAYKEVRTLLLDAERKLNDGRFVTDNHASALTLAEEYHQWCTQNHVTLKVGSVQERISSLGQHSLISRGALPPAKWTVRGLEARDPQGCWKATFVSVEAAQSYVDHMNSQQLK